MVKRIDPQPVCICAENTESANTSMAQTFANCHELSDALPQAFQAAGMILWENGLKNLDQLKATTGGVFNVLGISNGDLLETQLGGNLKPIGKPLALFSWLDVWGNTYW